MENFRRRSISRTIKCLELVGHGLSGFGERGCRRTSQRSCGVCYDMPYRWIVGYKLEGYWYRLGVGVAITHNRRLFDIYLLNRKSPCQFGNILGRFLISRHSSIIFFKPLLYGWQQQAKTRNMEFVELLSLLISFVKYGFLGVRLLLKENR